MMTFTSKAEKNHYRTWNALDTTRIAKIKDINSKIVSLPEP